MRVFCEKIGRGAVKELNAKNSLAFILGSWLPGFQDVMQTIQYQTEQ